MSRRAEMALIWAVWWACDAAWVLTDEWRFGMASLFPTLYWIVAVIWGDERNSEARKP